MRLLKSYLFCPILTGDMCDLLSILYAVIEELLVYSRLTGNLCSLLRIQYAVIEELLVLL